MSTDDQSWQEEEPEDYMIPMNIETEELLFELLHMTKSHTSRISSILRVSEEAVLSNKIDEYNIPALLAEGNKTMDRLWVFIRKLDAYIKAKQEEHRNSKD